MTLIPRFHILQSGVHRWTPPANWHNCEPNTNITTVQGCGEILMPIDDSEPPKTTGDYSGMAAGSPARHSCDCANCKTPCNVLKPTTAGWED